MKLKHGWFVMAIVVSIWAAIMFGILILLMGCGAMIEDEKILLAVDNAGYSKPMIRSKHYIMPTFYGCEKTDAAAFDVEAINVKNEKVKLIVCAGWPFKGVTIRF